MIEEKIIKESKKDPEMEKSRHTIIKIKHDTLKRIIIGLAGFVILILVFGLGMFVGANRARFSYRWAENYHRNFGGPKEGFMNDLRMSPPKGEFIQGHGIFGEIIQIGNSDIVIKGQDNAEKIIVISKDTVITIGRRAITKTDLKVGEQVVIIGSPNDEGQIEARLIRVFDGNIIMGPSMNINPIP